LIYAYTMKPTVICLYHLKVHNALMTLTIKVRRMSYFCLRHTPFECPKLRYSVSWEAPEKRRDLICREDDPGIRRTIGPSTTVSPRQSSWWTYERGTDQQLLTSLKKWLSWLKVNLLRFAIKQMSHQRGSGTLPRGIWTRDYAIATRGWRRHLFVALTYPRPPHCVRHWLLILYLVATLLS
jgi:hypothetical protein